MASVKGIDVPVPDRIRVFLVDDTRVGLRLMERSLSFANDDEFEVVGMASDSLEALRKIPSSAPNLLVTNLEMPGTDGLELAKRVRRSFPNIRILLTSDIYQESYARRASRAGAEEYCEKASLVIALANCFEHLKRPNADHQIASTTMPASRNWAEELFGGLLFSSAAGLAICDRSFRYEFINPALAAMNGITPREHISKSVREVLGDFANLLEPKLEQVFSTGKPLLNVEMTANALPSRKEPGKWIEDYFPITDSKGNVTHIAIVVVEAAQPQPGPRESGMVSLAPSSSEPQRIFRSWKEIASYAGTSVRTAQRWERDFELPVRRLRTERGVAVMGFKSDMDQWLAAAAQLPERGVGVSRSQVVIDGAALWEARTGFHRSVESTEILRSWKEIARHLAASVRTTQRWERELGLPVLRMGIKSGVALVAFKSELDQWVRSRGAVAVPPPQ